MRKYSIVHSVRVCTEFVPETFGRLTTIGPKFQVPCGIQGRYTTKQVCCCRCGNVVIACIGTLSCGCLQRQAASNANSRHGKSTTSEYHIWKEMRRRCGCPRHKNYVDYGGRGIRICERWKKFENFFADMGERPTPRHTLDRFPDQNGNYEPSNCRWATQTEQCNNRRSNRIITIKGKSDTLANWCRLYTIPYKAAHRRIAQNGWDPLTALTTPIKRKTKPE